MVHANCLKCLCERVYFSCHYCPVATICPPTLNTTSLSSTSLSHCQYAFPVVAHQYLYQHHHHNNYILQILIAKFNNVRTFHSFPPQQQLSSRPCHATTISKICSSSVQYQLLSGRGEGVVSHMCVSYNLRNDVIAGPRKGIRLRPSIHPSACSRH